MRSALGVQGHPARLSVSKTEGRETANRALFQGLPRANDTPCRPEGVVQGVE